MDGFSKEVLNRLPLAEGTLSLLAWVFDPAFLDGVFDTYRGRSYESELTFPTMVRLIQEALLEHDGSGHQAMVRAQDRDELDVSLQAVYGKLRRVPIELSLGFLACGSDRLREIFPAETAAKCPASLRAFDIYAVDGKKIKRVAKRLKPARQYSGTPLGGKVLVALDLRRGLVAAINAHPDGETNDAPLVPGLLPQVRKRSTRRVLWIADRQFCDLTQPRRFAEDGGAFLIRYHPKNSFHRDPNLPVDEGVDSQGRRYQQEWGHLGAPSNRRRLDVRRITLFREGEEEVILITDLLDAERYPARDLLDAYLARWGIERVFQQVTEVFHLQSLISSSPEGTIFQFAFCTLLYNMVQVTRAYISRAQHKPPETVSSEQLFKDVQRELIGLSTLAVRETVIEHFQPFDDARELTARLQKLFEDVWKDHWVKSPKKKIPKTPVKRQRINGGHTSIFRIIREANRQTE